MASNYRAWLWFRTQTLNQLTFLKGWQFARGDFKDRMSHNQNWAPETLSGKTLGRSPPPPPPSGPGSRPALGSPRREHSPEAMAQLTAPPRSERPDPKPLQSISPLVRRPRDLCRRDPQSPWPPPGPPLPPSRPPLGLRLTPSHPLNSRAPVTRRCPSRLQEPGGGALLQLRAGRPERRTARRGGTSRGWRKLLTAASPGLGRGRSVLRPARVLPPSVARAPPRPCPCPARAPPPPPPALPEPRWAWDLVAEARARGLRERRERWEPGGDGPERAKAAGSWEIPLLQGVLGRVA